MYCKHCGSEIEHEPEVAAVAESVSADVRIAEIQAERDVSIARLQARQASAELETVEHVAEVEADAEVASAEATAEIIGEVLAAESEGAEETEPEPVIITDAPEDDGLDLAPPVAEQHDSGPAKKPGWNFG